MEDKKVASKKELKLEKNGKVKKEWTVKRILTTIIIAILALLMVGGSFYYILSPGFSKKSQAFGFYDGEPVLYDNNNLFARTLMSDEDYATAYSSGDYTGVYSSWYKAYQAQVTFLAIKQMAEKAKILSPKSLVEKAFVNSGAFDDANGNFSEEVYNSISDSDKRSFYTYIENVYPFQVVVNDVLTGLTSSKEVEFVADLASDARTFEYFLVGANTLPDLLAKAYVYEHVTETKKVDVSMISCLTEDDINASYEELKNGAAWEDVVEKYSVDSYAENGGNLGFVTFAGVFANNMNDDSDVEKLVSLKVGEYTAPIAGPYGWSIYKLNAGVETIDTTDASTLSQLKQFIYQMDPEMVQSYIDLAVEDATVAAEKDFDAAASKYSFGKVSVGPVTNNFGQSSILYGVSYYDTNGYLATAMESDEKLNASLFNENVGYVVGPVEVEGGYLFAKVVEKTTENTMSQVAESMYSYYAPQFDIVDFENALLSSSKHEDNFVAKFIDLFFGN